MCRRFREQSAIATEEYPTRRNTDNKEKVPENDCSLGTFCIKYVCKIVKSSQYIKRGCLLKCLAVGKKCAGEKAMRYYRIVESDMGDIVLTAEEDVLTGLIFKDQISDLTMCGKSDDGNLPVFQKTVLWIENYWKGITDSDIPPMNLSGSLFQQKVWQEVAKIPYGHTASYGEIAERIGKGLNGKRVSPRSIGGALAKNPILLIIPCHRVILANGEIGGYAAGQERKMKLLSRERLFLKNEKEKGKEKF